MDGNHIFVQETSEKKKKKDLQSHMSKNTSKPVGLKTAFQKQNLYMLFCFLLVPNLPMCIKWSFSESSLVYLIPYSNLQWSWVQWTASDMRAALSCTAQWSCDHQWTRHGLPISCPPLESHVLSPDSRTWVGGTLAPSMCCAPLKCLKVK